MASADFGYCVFIQQI